MNKITSAWKLLISTVNHYRIFGASGVAFAVKQRLGGPVKVRIKPKGFKEYITLRNHTEDVPMFYFVFKEMEFDIPFEQKPRVIIDCGAHIGLTAIYYANKYPEALIYCVEPEKANFDLLVKNTKNYPNIKCLNCGIWPEPAELNVVDAAEGNWGFRTEIDGAHKAGSIRAITIGEIVKENGIKQIDVCKINIEGAEKELFEKNYKDWLSITNNIVIELHDRMKEGCSKSFFNALADFNFDVSWKGAYLVTTLRHN